MNAPEDPPADSRFYIVGGTLAADAPSYISRQADHDLIQALVAMEYCYVINARQMGKSSLCVRSMAALREAGYDALFFDLSSLGTSNATPEQWYFGIASRIGHHLKQRAEVARQWKADTETSPVTRLFDLLLFLLLQNTERRLVVILDEIDVVKSLPFSADEFFAAMRAAYNRRYDEPAFQRLAFCLVGAIHPSHLIANSQVSPFNIGRRIVMRDFGASELQPLAAGLSSGGRNGPALLQQIFWWTNGHPFLTQMLCSKAAQDPLIKAPADVEALVTRSFFHFEAAKNDINLSDVRNRFLFLDEAGEPGRIARLALYRQILAGEKIRDRDGDPVLEAIKMSGIVRVGADGLVRVRCPIYERVFDDAWVTDCMGNYVPASPAPGEDRVPANAGRRRAIIALASAAVLVPTGLLVHNAIYGGAFGVKRRKTFAKQKSLVPFAIARPYNGATVRETVRILISRSTLEGVKSITIFVDGLQASTITIPPIGVNSESVIMKCNDTMLNLFWNTKHGSPNPEAPDESLPSVSDGPHVFMVEANDVDGNVVGQVKLNMRVQNEGGLQVPVDGILISAPPPSMLAAYAKLKYRDTTLIECRPDGPPIRCDISAIAGDPVSYAVTYFGLQERRVHIGEQWNGPSPSFVGWMTTGLSERVETANKAVALEWQTGYQTLKIEQAYAPLEGIPIFSGAYTARISTVRRLWYAYKAAKVIYAEVTTKLEFDAPDNLLIYMATNKIIRDKAEMIQRGGRKRQVSMTVITNAELVLPGMR